MPSGSVEGTGNDLAWQSSNPTVATVNQGKVMGMGYGSAHITVKTKDGSQASCLVAVDSPTKKYRTINLSNYIKVSDNTATFKYQLLDETGKDITAEIPASQLRATSTLSSTISLDPSQGIGTITFKSSSDTDKPITIILLDGVSGTAVSLDSTSNTGSSSYTYPVGIPQPELPLTNPNQNISKITEIIITSTKLGITWNDGSSNDTGYATYVVKDQDGYDIANSPLANNLKVTSSAGIASTATRGLLKVDFGPNLDALSLTEVTVTITDSQSGVTATATLEITPQIRVISP